MYQRNALQSLLPFSECEMYNKIYKKKQNKYYISVLILFSSPVLLYMLYVCLNDVTFMSPNSGIRILSDYFLICLYLAYYQQKSLPVYYIVIRMLFTFSLIKKALANDVLLVCCSNCLCLVTFCTVLARCHTYC